MAERRLPVPGVSLPRVSGRRPWMPLLAAGLSLGEYLRSLVRRIAFLAAVLVGAVWALDGQGYLWPAWAWLGLGVIVLLDWAAVWAWRRAPGPERRVACVWTLVGAGAVILVFTWLLTWLLAGVQRFWPAWALLGLATLGSAYTLLTLHDRILVARGRRALRARVELLTRTRREAVDAQADELRRIERDLHDGAQARLVALTLSLGRAELRAQPHPELQSLIRDAQHEARQAIGELRDLARGIVPPLLADRGLVAAVESLAGRYGLGTAIDASGCSVLSPSVSSAAYFVIAEALTNSAKHAGACHTWVRLRGGKRYLVVLVGDDGCGGADVGGSGLAGLRARIEALDGRLRVMSRPGRGTVLEARLPCVS